MKQYCGDALKKEKKNVIDKMQKRRNLVREKLSKKIRRLDKNETVLKGRIKERQKRRN